MLESLHYNYVNFTDINGYEIHGYDINEEGLYCGSDRTVIEFQLWHLQVCD